MDFDPKLREASSEISAIFKKYDIGGYVVLTSPTHVEFVLEVDPTWSCATWEDKQEGRLRFKVSSKDMGKERAHQLAEKTAHLVCGTRDMLSYGFLQFEKCYQMLKTQMKIEHSTGTIIPRRDN